MLCDYAQVSEGKLYITGGGISRISGPGLPPGFTVAALLHVPWNDTNRAIAFTLDLVDQDGRAVTDPMGLQIRLQGQVEVGRPPGLEQGISIENAMTVNTGGISLPPGVTHGDCTSTVRRATSGSRVSPWSRVEQHVTALDSTVLAQYACVLEGWRPPGWPPSYALLPCRLMPATLRLRLPDDLGGHNNRIVVLL